MPRCKQFHMRVMTRLSSYCSRQEPIQILRPAEPRYKRPQKGVYLENVEKLLDAGSIVSAAPGYSSGQTAGRTALQAAAERGNLEIVLKLLAVGSDVSADPSGWGGRTALQPTAGRGHLEIVGDLLAAGSDVNAFPSGNYDRTALKAAAERGDLEIVEKLLAVGSDVNADFSYKDGLTALVAAAENGHLKIMDMLLAAGAETKSLAQDYEDKTDLVGMPNWGNMEVLAKLLVAKTDAGAGAKLKLPYAHQNLPHITAGEGQDVGVAEKIMMLDWG